MLCGFCPPCKSGQSRLGMKHELTIHSCNAFTARAETLPWTPHLDECLELVERGDDQAQDQMLASLLKLQRIIDEAHRYLIVDLMPVRKGGTKAPTYLYKPGLLERLKTVRKEIPDRYSYNSTLHPQTFSLSVKC